MITMRHNSIHQYYAACYSSLALGRAQAFAMTENSHQVSSNPLPHRGARKAGSVGKAQGSVEARAPSTRLRWYIRVVADILMCAACTSGDSAHLGDSNC